jgi:hypothetical protein
MSFKNGRVFLRDNCAFSGVVCSQNMVWNTSLKRQRIAGVAILSYWLGPPCKQTARRRIYKTVNLGGIQVHACVHSYTGDRCRKMPYWRPD